MIACWKGSHQDFLDYSKMLPKFLFAFLSLVTVSLLFSSPVISHEEKPDGKTSLPERKHAVLEDIKASHQAPLSLGTETLPSWTQLLAHLSEKNSSSLSTNAEPTKEASSPDSDSLKEVIHRLYRNDQEFLLRAKKDSILPPIHLGWLFHGFPHTLSEEHIIEIFIQAFYPDPAINSLNLFTGEGLPSEIIAQRITGYLICQEIVTLGSENTGSSPFFAEAQKQLKNLNSFLRQTVQNAYRIGIEDWDSSATYPLSISAWLTLFDNATSPDVRDCARAMLDWYAATIALRTLGNTFGGPESLHNVMPSPLNDLSWLWWGEISRSTLPVSDENSLLFYASLSDYQPPVITQALARKTSQTLYGQYHESKPLNLGKKETPFWQSRVHFYIGPSYTLGASVLRPTGGWTSFARQEILWKLVAINRAEHSASWLVTGSSGRDPWRQVSQWKNVLFDVWHTPMDSSELANKARLTIQGANPNSWYHQWQKSFAKRFPDDRVTPNPVKINKIAGDGRRATLSFPSADSALSLIEQIVFIQLDQTYLAIRSINEKSPILQRTSQDTVLSDPVPLGWFGGFIIEVGSQSEYPTFSDFQAAIHNKKSEIYISANSGKIDYTNLSGERIQFSYNTKGSYTEPIYNWGYGDTLGQSPAWPTGEGHGRVPLLLINGEKTPTLSQGTVYQGPALTLKNGILTIEIEDNLYQVDFSGEQPVFRQNERSSQDNLKTNDKSI